MADNMTTDNRIRSIAIVGGGTAGWMTAAAFSKILGTRDYQIQLIESDAIGSVGVGEATIPNIQKFNHMLGIDEQDFLWATQGTFKLGIQFVNWGKIGNQYIHPFGSFGNSLGALTFYHYWLKYHQQGNSEDIGEFSIAAQAALKNKFMPPLDVPNSPLSQIGYAYHFDAGLYAKYLRRFSESLGVKRMEGEIVGVTQNATNGFVESLQLKSGEIITADLFIDCSGFRGLLIENTLNTGFENWSDQLFCDRAIAVPSACVGAPEPYTRSTAHSAGWQWRIPLQHRVGNGHVFSSKYMSEDEATAILLKNIEGEPLAEPRTVYFKTGMRKKFWNKNCVAIGLSSGFLEPLESTSIYLIQSSISKLLTLFPTKSFEPSRIEKYNEMVLSEFMFVRDFIVMHYKLNQRTDSPFWRACNFMDVPASLQKRIQMYQTSGRLMRDNAELFDEMSWMAVMHGQGLVAQDYHPVVDTLDEKLFNDVMPKIKAVIANAVATMPTHGEFLAHYCAAGMRE